MGNPTAEIFDVFFNGRPAPKDQPYTVRVRLTPEHIAKLEAGQSLIFRKGPEHIIIVPTEGK